MADLIFKLHDLPDLGPYAAALGKRGIELRRAFTPERSAVLAWVDESFPLQKWRDETEVAFARHPVSCFVAVADVRIVGFACYDVTFRGFLGPGGVAPTHRRQGVFTALALRVMWALSDSGYAYGVLGAAADATRAALERVVELYPVPGSDDGVYRQMLIGETSGRRSTIPPCPE